MVKGNEEGLTLVELLATVAILSIASILIWSVFFQGKNYSNMAITNNQMQQEANIIISSLTKIHQTSDKYTVESSNCKITVNYTLRGSDYTENFEQKDVCIYIRDDIEQDKNDFTTGEIFPKSSYNYTLWINIEDNKHPNNNIKVESIFSRL